MSTKHTTVTSSEQKLKKNIWGKCVCWINYLMTMMIITKKQF